MDVFPQLRFNSRFNPHSEPGCQKKSGKNKFHEKFFFVKSIFTGKIQYLLIKSSKYEPDLTPKIRCSDFSLKFAQIKPICLKSTLNFVSIRVGARVLRRVYVIILVFWTKKLNQNFFSQLQTSIIKRILLTVLP